MPRLFVGNLPFDVTDDELKSWIEGRGQQVEELRIMRDRDTGKPRGFALVTVHGDATKATAAMKGQDFKGRNLTVNEAPGKGEISGETILAAKAGESGDGSHTPMTAL